MEWWEYELLGGGLARLGPEQNMLIYFASTEQVGAGIRSL